MTDPDGHLKRPGAITCLAILGWIGGGAILPLASLGLLGTLVAPGERDTVLAAFFAILIVLAGAQLVAALGLWRIEPSGRRWQIMVSSVGLIATPIGTIISVVILLYF